YPLAELDAMEVIAVRREGRLGEGAAVDVVEDLSGELAPRQFAVVVDRSRGEVEAVVAFVLGHNSLCSTPSGALRGPVDARRGLRHASWMFETPDELA